METLIIQDRNGEFLSVAYVYQGPAVWFVSYFDHKVYSEPVHVYFHHLSKVA